jgi:hypothetical protein
MARIEKFSCPGSRPWAALILTLEFVVIKLPHAENMRHRQNAKQTNFLIGERNESNENK